jgi:DNA-binding SARP family transcriptional activator
MSSHLPSDVRPLVDFLNHGLLPDTGRATERQRLVEFWRTTADAGGLRVAILIGEAGIGKSRLVEGVVAGIEREGGAVVHLKLYENTAASLLSSTTRAIASTRLGGRLHSVEEGDAAAAALPLLRRLSRLRSTLVVVEDLHLLEGEALEELARLLRGMTDETLSFLAVTRPVELPSRGVLEPWLVDEIELAGLDAEQIGTLWSRLFEGAPPEGMIEALHDATLGNPLALRSALRGALRSEMIVHDPATGAWRITGSIRSVGGRLKRNVEILSEGMASHLSPAERAVAGQLALLGEVFSREAASALVEGAPDAIGRLLFAGILVRSTLPTPPLPGDESEELPLAFTHTLVHRYFVGAAGRNHERLLRTIASGRPLYSILPFQLLAETTDPGDFDPALLRAAIARAVDVALRLDTTADWKLGLETWRAASALFTRCADCWEEVARLEIEAELLNLRLTLYRREDYGREYEELVERLLEITERPLSPLLEEYRILGYAFRQRFVWRQTHSISQEAWDAVHALAEATPRLLFTLRYLIYLEAAARSALYANLLSELQDIEKRVHALLASPEATEEYSLSAKRRFYPLFLPLFNTHEELELRRRMLDELEQIADERLRPTMLTFKVGFLDQIGDVAGVLSTARYAIPLFQALDLNSNVYHASIDAICAEVAQGADLERSIERAIGLLDGAPGDVADLLRVHYGRKLSGLALLMGRFDLAREVLGRFAEQERQPYRATLALLMLEQCDGDPERLEAEMKRLMTTAPGETMPVRTIALLAGEEVSRDEMIAEATLQLGEAFLRTTDILAYTATIALLRAADRSGRTAGLVAAMAPVIESTVARIREWIERQSLQRFSMLLDHPLVSDRKSKRSNTAPRSRTATPKESGRLVEVSMLGKITIRLDGEEAPVAVRGSRLRTMLGILVADRMLQTPLSWQEMAHLALDESDPERSRVALNGIIYRLRNLVGAEAITTEAETPQLDMARVRVDLLEARGYLLRSAAALGNGSIVQARRPLLEAFRLVGGEVPFPSLYGNFFEAIREDFERSLRTTTIAVAEGMISEGDAMGGEELLLLACETMPGDRDLEELLCQALTQLGKGVEAARIRIRMQLGAV